MYLLLTPIQDFLETKFNVTEKKNDSMTYLSQPISPNACEWAHLEVSWEKKLICDLPRPVWEFAEIKNSILQINNNDFYTFLLMSINMQKIVIAIDRLLYFGHESYKKNLKNILLLSVNLELLFNLRHTSLNQMLTLSWHESSESIMGRCSFETYALASKSDHLFWKWWASFVNVDLNSKGKWYFDIWFSF